MSFSDPEGQRKQPGQAASFEERWDQLDMPSRLSTAIMRDTELGRLALDLHEAAEVSHDKFNAACTISRALKEDAAHEVHLAAWRTEIVNLMALRIQADLLMTDGGRDDEVAFKTALHAACDERMLRINESSHLDDDEKAELRGLAQNVAFLFWDEDGHFRREATIE